MGIEETKKEKERQDVRRREKKRSLRIEEHNLDKQKKGLWTILCVQKGPSSKFSLVFLP